MEGAVNTVLRRTALPVYSVNAARSELFFLRCFLLLGPPPENYSYNTQDRERAGYDLYRIFSHSRLSYPAIFFSMTSTSSFTAAALFVSCAFSSSVNRNS